MAVEQTKRFDGLCQSTGAAAAGAATRDDPLVIADGHTDLLLELGHRELRNGETSSFARTWLPLLEAGGVGLQVCPVFVELERQPEGTLREALGQATCLLRAVRDNPGRVIQVRTLTDLDVVERGERIGLMLSLEGVEQFGYETWPAETFWELGVRMAGLTWNRRNPFADGAAEQGGLSRLGRALVDRLLELGIVLDLAHTSPGAFAEILDRAGDTPVVCSHAGCRALNDHPRNLDDVQMRELAARGGLLGLMLHPLAIGHETRTIDRVIDHLEHAVEVMGADRVCLGGDFTTRLSEVLPQLPPPADGLMPDGLDPGAGIEGLKGPEDYPALLEALAQRGWDAASIEAVASRNLLALLRRALPA
jgi:membrane dipeptidase